MTQLHSPTKTDAMLRGADTWPTPILGLAYLVSYVFLDWVSFLHPLAPFGITPWNPPTGLSIAFILLFGRKYLWLLFIAPLLANLAVRHVAMPPLIELMEVLIIGCGYGGAVLFLLRPQLRFNPRLPAMRDLMLLLAVAVISAAVVASAYVAVFAASGLLPVQDFSRAALRYWVGDVIGIAIVTPFLLLSLRQGFPSEARWELASQVAVIVIALWLIFGLAQANQFQLFYLLFLPIVWIALRTGISGVSYGLVLTQLGLIVAIQMSRHNDIDVTAFQVLMLVLTFTGLAAGMQVSERRRAEAELRRQREALAHAVRLSSMGEFAAALAHEINQPLTATGTYSRLVRDALRSGAPPTAVTIEAADKAVVQIERAANVVCRIRELVRLGHSDVAPVSARRIVRETLDMFGPELQIGDIAVRTVVAESLPDVMADSLQIQQVLINLLRNSVEAIRSADQPRAEVSIEVGAGEPGFVEFSVHDNGPGFHPEIADGALLPFSTTKPDGLGIGLSLSSSIVEVHNGRLWIADGRMGGSLNGAVVRFTLPIAAPTKGKYYV